MVYKTPGAFSIYRHVNRRRRTQKQPFDVRDSPSPSPEHAQDPAKVSTQRPLSPTMSLQSESIGQAATSSSAIREPSSSTVPLENGLTEGATQSTIITQQSSTRAVSGQLPSQGRIAPNSSFSQQFSEPAKLKQVDFTRHTVAVKLERDAPEMTRATLPASLASPAPYDSSSPRLTAQPKPRLGLHKATIEAVRKARNIVAKPRPRPHLFEDTSSDEAEEAPITEAVHLGSRSRGIAAAALVREQPKVSEHQPPTQEDPTGVAILTETVANPQQNVVGIEHRQFYMHTRRSLRGGRTTNGEHMGSRLHVVPPEEYFDMCDEDVLFGDEDDATSMAIDRKNGKLTKNSFVDTPHVGQVEDAMDCDHIDIMETAAPRVRTRSRAPNSVVKSKQAVENSTPRSDIEAQKHFSSWIARLVRSKEDLTTRLEASENRVEELKVVVSIKDEDIEKLEARIQKHKKRATNEAYLANFKSEIVTLREQLATAHTQIAENKTRYTEQIAAVSNMSASQASERHTFERQLHDLQCQINVLKSHPRTVPPIPLLSLTSRPYSSPLRAAITRDVTSASPPTPTVDAARYKTLHDAAKSVITEAEVGHMIGNPMFPKFAQLLQDLKDELDRLPKLETW